MSWTEQLVHDEKVSGRVAEITQHYYVGGEANAATSQQAFTLGSAGTVKPTQIESPAGRNLTAYCNGGAGEDYVTIINKTQGAEAADAAITILPYGPGAQGAEIMTLASPEPGDATAASATLGGASITGDGPFRGRGARYPPILRRESE